VNTRRTHIVGALDEKMSREKLRYAARDHARNKERDRMLRSLALDPRQHDSAAKKNIRLLMITYQSRPSGRVLLACINFV
jgi:hypothetical protein